MKRIRKKLNSQVGASITFALLLFLVCAVLCSVIITAATTASGRMSGLVASDQRYYAVTSATELLEDVFEKHPTVSIIEVVETPVTTTYTDGVPGTPEKGSSTKKVYVLEKKAAEINESDYKNADGSDKTQFLYKIDNSDFKIDTIQKDAAIRVYNSTPLNTINGTDRLSLTSLGSGSDNTLAVSISEELDINGNIMLTLYNKYKSGTLVSDAGSRYTLVLSFGADKSVSTREKTENVSSTPGDDHTYTVLTKTTETTITSLSWTLDGIRTKS